MSLVVEVCTSQLRLRKRKQHTGETTFIEVGLPLEECCKTSRTITLCIERTATAIRRKNVHCFVLFVDTVKVDKVAGSDNGSLHSAPGHLVGGDL